MTQPGDPALMPIVAAFDPGRNVGYALVDGRGRLIEKRVLADRDVAALDLPAGCIVVMGSGTGHASLQAMLERAGYRVVLVAEEGTSLEGRELWRDHEPARGWQRLLPRGLRSPDRPIDDYAAWAIALRYLTFLGSPSRR